MTTKEIAKKIRADLKAMKGYKFSVRTETYAGGSSINVNVMKSPIRMIRTPDEIPVNVNVYNYTREQINDMQSKKYHQLSNYILNGEYDVESWNNGVFLTEAGHKDLMKVNEIIKKYHWDESDSSIDYFHTNFYYHIELGKWDVGIVESN